MMLATVTLVTVIAILSTIYLVTKNKSKKYPPGPFPWPFFGNVSFLKRLTRELGGQHLAFIELTKRYGSDVITLHLGISKLLVVSGSRLVQAVTKSEEFDGRPWSEFIKLRNLGKKQGITMNDGPEWKELRTWMVQTMKTIGFGTCGMSEMIKDELIVVLERLKGGGVRRLKPVIAPAVINVLWTFVTGKRFSEGRRLQYFTDLMERRSRMFDMVGGRLSTFPWIRYIAPEASGYNLLVTLNKELKDFLMASIAEHKKKYVSGSENDLIDMFFQEMANRKQSGSIFNEEQLVMILIDLFLAGVTNAATTLDILFLSMVVHQDVQQKLQKEIDSVIPSDRLPDLTDRSKLPYAEAVMRESQRLRPVIPIIGPRRVLYDTKLDGYTIPKNSTVLINMYSVNMDPNCHPDPHEFKPERFLKDGAYEIGSHDFTFGRGRRRCPGEVLARSALFLLFVGVMQKYSLLPVPGKGPTTIETVPGLTITPKPYEILLVPR